MTDEERIADILYFQPRQLHKSPHGLTAAPPITGESSAAAAMRTVVVDGPSNRELDEETVVPEDENVEDPYPITVHPRSTNSSGS